MIVLISNKNKKPLSFQNNIGLKTIFKNKYSKNTKIISSSDYFFFLVSFYVFF